MKQKITSNYTYNVHVSRLDIYGVKKLYPIQTFHPYLIEEGKKKKTYWSPIQITIPLTHVQCSENTSSHFKSTFKGYLVLQGKYALHIAACL